MQNGCLSSRSTRAPSARVRQYAPYGRASSVFGRGAWTRNFVLILTHDQQLELLTKFLAMDTEQNAEACRVEGPRGAAFIACSKH